MVLETAIVDAHGTGKRLKINGEGELSVTIHTHPPSDEQVAGLPFRQYFTNDGSDTGSFDMAVNGSSSTVRFWIKASNDFDIYVKTVSLQISDNGARLDRFGALTALANGVRFFYRNISTGESVISDGIKTNLDAVRLSLGQPAFGSGTDAFKADISGGGADTYLPVIDLSATFGLPWGVRLVKGSTDILAFEVQDNISGLDQFDIIGYGIKVVSNGDHS